jgi:uncharacterized protein YjbI with pentapeptide repeats
MTAVEWEEPEFLAALKSFGDTGRLDATNRRIDADQLSRILDAIPRDAGTRYLTRACFQNAYFDGDVNFQGVRFRDEAAFNGAEFAGSARFSGAVFEDWAAFANAIFHLGGDFSEARFVGEAVFAGVRFLGKSRASFDGARFSVDANFNRARFWTAQFNDAEFSAHLRSAGMRSARDVFLAGTAFRGPVTLGPLLAGRRLVIDRAVFDEDGQIHASTPELSCIRTRFVGRADLKLRWTEIVLDDTLFLERSWLTGSPPFSQLDEDLTLFDSVRRSDGRDLPLQEQPRLLSIREANVAALGLSGVDLRACRFARAQGLDQLRLEADCEFATAPDDWRHTGRRTLAEEHHWRSQQDADGGWHLPERRPSYWLETSDRPVEVLDPPTIAALYRSLRKALEDSKNEPGAADFYYGEMEMRRQGVADSPRRQAWGRGIPRAEQGIITLYWLLSGYGLRASRAIAVLVALIAVSTVAFHLYGFQDRVRPFAAKSELKAQPKIGFPPTLGEVFDGAKSIEALTYAAGTATAIVGAPDAQLTQTGRALRLWLRIFSPLLIGLALLAVRGRVKR